MTLRLVHNWRDFWRLRTFWGGVVITLMSLLQAEVLPLWQFTISAAVFPWITGALGLVVLVLRQLELREQPVPLVRLASAQASIALGVLSGLQAQVLPLFAFAVPAHIYPWLTAGLGTAISMARLIAQDAAAVAPQEPPQ